MNILDPVNRFKKPDLLLFVVRQVLPTPLPVFLLTDEGNLEVIEGHPEGANIPFMPDAPQEFASGLDADLRKLAQQVRVKWSMKK